MMTLEQIRDLIILISSEKGNDVNYGPEEFCDLIHLAQLRHYKRKLGLPEEYSPGVPLPRQAFEINQRITEDMRRFKVINGYGITEPKFVNKGVLAIPKDYFIVTGLSYNYYLKNFNEILPRKIEILSDLEYNDRVTSLVKRPTNMFPVATVSGSKILIYPDKISHVDFTYLRLPKKPVWKVIDNDGFYEYDAVNSVNVEWNDLNIIDIVSIMLSDIGIKTKQQDVLQYAEKLKEKGI